MQGFIEHIENCGMASYHLGHLDFILKSNFNVNFNVLSAKLELEKELNLDNNYSDELFNKVNTYYKYCYDLGFNDDGSKEHELITIKDCILDDIKNDIDSNYYVPVNHLMGDYSSLSSSEFPGVIRFLDVKEIYELSEYLTYIKVIYKNGDIKHFERASSGFGSYQLKI